MNNINNQMITLLKQESDKIKPSKELFQQVMDKITISVTKELNPRYSYMEEAIGRPSLEKINIITKISNLMNINSKIWTSVGAVAVIGLIIVGSNQMSMIKRNTIQEPISNTVSVSITDNVDDMASEILNSVSDDELLFVDLLKDSELIAVDNQLISNFGQSFYENEF